MYVTITKGEPGDGFQFTKDLSFQDVAACLSGCTYVRMYVRMLYSRREIQVCISLAISELLLVMLQYNVL